MAISFERKAHGGGKPIFWRGECKVLPGGFKPAQDFSEGTIIDKGTPLHVNFDNMEAAVCKVAIVLAGGTTSAPRVAKGNLFEAGDDIAATIGEPTAIKISSIDRSNPAYDVLTLSEAIDGLGEGKYLYESNSAGDAKYEPNAVVAAELVFDGKGLPTIDAAYEALIIKKNAYPVLPEFFVSEMCLTGNPSIKYINQ